MSGVHAAPAPFFASAGQFGPLPGQFSVKSHASAADRHGTLVDAKPSVGQVVLVPVHVSATSHVPAPARQVAPAFPAGC